MLPRYSIKLIITRMKMHKLSWITKITFTAIMRVASQSVQIIMPATMMRSGSLLRANNPTHSKISNSARSRL